MAQPITINDQQYITIVAIQMATLILYHEPKQNHERGLSATILRPPFLIGANLQAVHDPWAYLLLILIISLGVLPLILLVS